jgi:hypothetical protein
VIAFISPALPRRLLEKVLFPLTLSLSKGSDLKIPEISDRFDKLNASGFKFTTFCDTLLRGERTYN